MAHAKDASYISTQQNDSNGRDSTGRQETSPLHNNGSFAGSKHVAQPESRGANEFYRIVVQPKEGFRLFRRGAIGKKLGLKSLAGKRKSGIWGTQAWLVSKEDAHTEGPWLIPDSRHVRKLFRRFGRLPVQLNGDVFTA